MQNSTPLCKDCRRPIYDGEPRWYGYDPEEHWHYDCATQAGLTLQSKLSAAARNLAPGLARLSRRG